MRFSLNLLIHFVSMSLVIDLVLDLHAQGQVVGIYFLLIKKILFLEVNPILFSISISRAKKDNYIDQIAKQRGYESRQFWRCLSIFDNGRRIYHRKVDDAFYRLPCT